MIWFNGHSHTVVQCLNDVILFEHVHQFWKQKMINIHRNNAQSLKTQKLIKDNAL